jgi:two-component system, sensor histidine kinase
VSDAIGLRLAEPREVPDMDFDRPGALPAIPGAILEKWQGLVDTMADIVGVPAGLIMRIAHEDIEVLVANRSDANPYRPDDSEHLGGSGLYCEPVIKKQARASGSRRYRE